MVSFVQFLFLHFERIRYNNYNFYFREQYITFQLFVEELEAVTLHHCL